MSWQSRGTGRETYISALMSFPVTTGESPVKYSSIGSVTWGEIDIERYCSLVSQER